MIKEKYMQLLLYAQMGGITTIDDTQTLSVMLPNGKGGKVCKYKHTTKKKVIIK
jgi:hypothetical protein